METFIYATVIIFPLLLIPICIFSFLANKYKSRRIVRKTDVTLPSLSILLPTYNDESTMQKTLDSIEAQEYPFPIHVMIVNDGSTDRTHEEITEWLKHFRYHQYEYIINEKNKGRKSLAIKEHLCKLRGETTVLLDGDTYIEAGAIKKMITQMEEEGASIITGTIAVSEDIVDNSLSDCQKHDYRYTCEFRDTIYVVAPGTYSAVKTKEIQEFAPTDTSIVEDVALTLNIKMRKGLHASVCAAAVAHTQPQPSFKFLLKQRVRWAFSLYETFFKATLKGGLNDFATRVCCFYATLSAPFTLCVAAAAIFYPQVILIYIATVVAEVAFYYIWFLLRKKIDRHFFKYILLGFCMWRVAVLIAFFKYYFMRSKITWGTR
jgi:biofilm PGA synthesis N-glycosyltransferase PgaC